jgi:hypothetical protein
MRTDSFVLGVWCGLRPGGVGCAVWSVGGQVNGVDTVMVGGESMGDGVDMGR